MKADGDGIVCRARGMARLMLSSRPKRLRSPVAGSKRALIQSRSSASAWRSTLRRKASSTSRDQDADDEEHEGG